MPAWPKCSVGPPHRASACDALIEAALANGGPDNTTAIVADVRLEGGESETQAFSR